MHPVAPSKHAHPASIGQQNARAHEWQGGALTHMWKFIWTGILSDGTAVLTVVQDTGFEKGRNNPKGSWLPGEMGTVQQRSSATSVRVSDTEEFSRKIVEINV